MSETTRKIVAVIPAAGRGTRLASNRPKILTPVRAETTIWTLLSSRLLAIVDHINVIVSPDAERLMRSVVEDSKLTDLVSLSVQPEPIGMGDAIFCGFPVWSCARSILIVWGDQVFVSDNTLRRACSLHGGDDRTLVLPVVSLSEPYVEYVFSNDGGIVAVRQSREGDLCAPNGYADVGTFVLSVDSLQAAWNKFLLATPAGTLTHEINFLPFLPFLWSLGWTVRRLVVEEPCEARGINTPDDLDFLRSTIDIDKRVQ